MRYLKLTVVKKVEGTIFVAVPDDFITENDGSRDNGKNKAMHWKYQDSVGEAAREQVEDQHGWDDTGWDTDVEVEHVELVTKEEAEARCLADTVPELKKQEETELD